MILSVSDPFFVKSDRLLGTDERIEVLWWRPEAWGPVGQFGSVFELDDALVFIAEESTFWIRT